jgi:hypothetical protein
MQHPHLLTAATHPPRQLDGLELVFHTQLVNANCGHYCLIDQSDVRRARNALPIFRLSPARLSISS